MTNLTTPTFEGTGSDEVELIDAYVPVDTEVKNKLTSKASNFKDNIKGNLEKALGQGNIFKDTLGNLGDNLSLGLTLSQRIKASKERIENALKGDRAAINSIMGDMQNSLLGNISGLGPTGNLVNRASESIDRLMVIGDNVNNVLKGDTNALGKALGLIGAMSGTRLGEFIDLGVYTSFAAEIINEIQHIEDTANYLELIFKSNTDESGHVHYDLDEDVRFEIGRTVSSKITSNINLEFLEELIVHVGTEALTTDRPNFIKDLLANYRMPEGLVIESDSLRDYTDELNTLVNVLDSLKDDWFYLDWNGKQVWNLYSINELSEDMEELLLHSDLHRDAVLTAKFYKEKTFKESVTNIYPFFPI